MRRKPREAILSFWSLMWMVERPTPAQRACWTRVAASHSSFCEEVLRHLALAGRRMSSNRASILASGFRPRSRGTTRRISSPPSFLPKQKLASRRLRRGKGFVSSYSSATASDFHGVPVHQPLNHGSQRTGGGMWGRRRGMASPNDVGRMCGARIGPMRIRDPWGLCAQPKSY